MCGIHDECQTGRKWCDLDHLASLDHENSISPLPNSELCPGVKNADFIYRLEAASCRVMIGKYLESELREHLPSFCCQATAHRVNVTFRPMTGKDWI